MQTHDFWRTAALETPRNTEWKMRSKLGEFDERKIQKNLTAGILVTSARF